MPSAFRRAGPKAKIESRNSIPREKSTATTLVGFRGVKPWTGGIHLTSTGLNDLDVVLGGGQPIGTCILLREDRWTRDLALSIAKYWIAEAVSHDQRLIVPVAKNSAEQINEFDDSFSKLNAEDNCLLASDHEVESLLLSIPRNLHWDKQNQRAQQVEQPGEANHALTILEEGEFNEDDDLQVAWQYKKSVQEERSGLSGSRSVGASSPGAYSVFCHSYDLSGRMIDQNSMETAAYIYELGYDKRKSMTMYEKGFGMFRDLIDLVKNARNDGKAIRLALIHSDLGPTCIALPLLLAYIREHALPVVILVCMSPSADSKSLFSLSRTADVVMSTEGFASRKEYPPPPEFRHLQGLLTLSKVSTITAATANGGGHFADLTMSRRPAAYIYGLKRDRRKLHILLLHIPPEDYAEGGGSVGSGVRSGAGKKPAEGESTRHSPSGGLGCASNMSGSPLDF